MHYCEDYGFGIVDAHAAIRMAESWTQINNSLNEQALVTTNNNAVNIADNGSITSIINVSNSSINLEHVEVYVDIDHSRIGDLVLTLISPDGTESILVNRPEKPLGSDAANYGSTQNGLKFTLSSRHYLGETGNGNWILKVEDKASGVSGVLNNWDLKFYGSAKTNDDTYTFTKEFNGNKTISDVSGNDAIDATGILTDSTIDLRAGNTSSINGKNLTIAAGSIIENAYLGDGDDTLRGKLGNDLIFGGVGADTIYGGQDNDILFGGSNNNPANYDDNKSNTIYGEAGSDTIYGDAGADKLYGGYGDDQILGLDGNDEIYGEENNDTIYGGGGNDKIYGGNDNDILQGDLGNDKLFGDAGNDVLRGNKGNNEYSGGAGNDVFVIMDNANGTDIINDFEVNNPNERINLLNLTNIQDFSQLTLTQLGSDTLIQFGDNQKVILKNIDKSLINRSHFITSNHAPEVVSQPSERSSFVNTPFSFTIQNSFVDSDGDALTYTAKLSDGSPLPSWISFNPSTLTFSGTAVGTAYNAVIVVTATDSKGASTSLSFDFKNYDGVVINGTPGNDFSTGTSGNDYITGAGGDDYLFAGGIDSDVNVTDYDGDKIYGEAGNDSIWGANGNDIIDGGSGDDYIYGNKGDDIIRDGSGKDVVYGGDGNDIIYLEGGNQLTTFGGSIDTAFSGEAGNDSFVIAKDISALAGTGILNDIIWDFEVNNPNEKIDLTAFKNVRDISDLRFGNVNLNGAQFLKVYVAGEENNQFITLKGITSNQLQNPNFIFFNDKAPIAANDTIATNEEASVLIRISDLIRNDSDNEDGSPVFYNFSSQPTHGALVNNNDGTYTYTPAINFNGSDSFSYKVKDSNGAVRSAIVNIAVTSVNDIPTATVTTAAVNEDNSLTIDVLTSAADADGDILTISSITNGANGIVSIVADG